MTHEEERRGREGGRHVTITYSTMVFTSTKINVFFTEATHMGLSACTRQALDDEGISAVTELHEWEDDEWDQFTQNCKRRSQIFDPTNDQDLINQHALKVPVKS